MTMFWIICGLLLLVAVMFVVLPLLRSSVKGNQVLRDAANLEIFRDQVAEMDADLRNGLLTPEMYEQGRREIQTRLLEEVNSADGTTEVLVRNPHKVLAITLAVLMPITALGVYWKIGNHDALQGGSGHSTGTGMEVVRSESALKDLESKVAQNPQDADSLRILANSYAQMERFVEAAQTYNKLTKIVTQDAQVWADFADSLAMANGQNLSGHPTLLINTALTFDPNNLKALALAGSAAMGRGDFPTAIKYWEHLLTILPADSEDAKMITDGIQQARAGIAQGKGGKAMTAQSSGANQDSKPAAGKEAITGQVFLSDAIKAQANPNDTVFVLARATEGPPMPLAVIRKQVKDLPLNFKLDDSMALSPQTKLSNFDKVVLVARVSKSGEPLPHPGDLQGMSSPLKPGSQGIKLNIDTVVK